jgi:perosamine synthetase
MNEMKVPLCIPDITDEEVNSVSKVLMGGWLAHGEYNKKFENLFAKTLGVKNAISVNSCTSAIEIALKASDISKEVIIPSMTFVATANAVINSGCVPVFCDVDLSTRNLDARSIKEKITPNTEAIIVVHYAGQPCNMDEISRLCHDRKLLLIEDSAQTFGARWNGKQAGSYGIGCFSFFPTKNITTAEGGMFTTNDDNLAEKARALTSHGIVQSQKKSKPWNREASFAGHNYRMPNPLAAIGYIQLQKIDELNKKRNMLAKYYNESFMEKFKSFIKCPYVLKNAEHTYQMYTIEVSELYRDNLVGYLNDCDIGASVHYDPPVHMQSIYRKYLKSDTHLVNTEQLARTLVTLPMYPSMTKIQIDYIVNSIQKFIEINKIPGE